MIESTVCCSSSSAATSSAATFSSPRRTRIRGSPLTIVFESARLFWLNVSWAASTTTRKVWRPASVGLTWNVTRLTPTTRSRRLVSISAPSANRRTVAGWATVERISAVASMTSPIRAVAGRRQALDEHLVATLEADDPGLDLDAARRGEGGLHLARARGVVAVGEEDDPLLRVVGEERGREAERGADVRGAPDWRRPHPVDFLEVGRQALDERLLAERDDARDVVLRHLLEAVADELERLLAAALAHRVGEVEHEDRRQPVDRQDELEPREREDERREEDRPDEQCRPAPAGPQPAAGAEVEQEREQQRRRQQEQRQRGVEGEAHHAPPAGRRPSRAPISRQIRMTASRW